MPDLRNCGSYGCGTLSRAGPFRGIGDSHITQEVLPKLGHVSDKHIAEGTVVVKGAGGSPGGVGGFFLGSGMLVGGGYLLLNSIMVTSNFGMGRRLYSYGSGQYGITSGMVLIPFLIGIVLVFRDGRSKAGWALSSGSVVALVFGVLSSIHFRMRHMTAFELLTVLVLAFGGLGLILRSLRSSDRGA